jgi:hypothetical protein
MRPGPDIQTSEPPQRHHTRCDKRFLLAASPALQLALAAERIPDRLEGLGVDQPDRPASGGVAGAATGIVDALTFGRVEGVARVEGIVGASQNVDVVQA